MERGPAGHDNRLRKSDLARILSPLIFFFAHVAYLAAWSPDPFLKRWIEGSFTFFLALVACNIIRNRYVAARGNDLEGGGNTGGEDSGGGSRGADG